MCKYENAFTSFIFLCNLPTLARRRPENGLPFPDRQSHLIHFLLPCLVQILRNARNIPSRSNSIRPRPVFGVDLQLISLLQIRVEGLACLCGIIFYRAEAFVEFSSAKRLFGAF